MEERTGGIPGGTPRETVESPLPGSTLVLRVAYDGTDFSGYALQERQTHVRTVAGELQQALRVLLRRDVVLTCAGRTDAGVHARAQHVSLAVTAEEATRIDGERLLRSLGAILPDDVRVERVYRANEGFSARFDAQARRYRYRLAAGPVAPLFNARWAWWLRMLHEGDLDVAAMERAAQCLVGEHDFKSFCKSASAVDKPTCRFVEWVRLEREEALGESMLVVDIAGNAFLHSMVRTIVGTLVEVGCGRRAESWVPEVLAACDRRAAGPCAPACGLTLWEVRYPDGALTSW